MVTQEEYDGPSSTNKIENKEEVQKINNASEKIAVDSPGGGGGEKVNQEEEGEEYKKYNVEVIPPKDPLTEVDTSKKRNVSPQKPLAWKKTQFEQRNQMIAQL